MWPYVLAAALGALAAIVVLGAVYLPRIHQLMDERNQWRMEVAELDRSRTDEVRITPGDPR